MSVFIDVIRNIYLCFAFLKEIYFNIIESFYITDFY